MTQPADTPAIDLRPVLELHVGSAIGQCRAVPVNLGPGQRRAILAVYAADFDVDPYTEMFFFPTDTLKMICFDDTGRVFWRKDLGRAVVPGMWFCPVMPFDLNGDGVDEIYFVNNLDAGHPLAHTSYRLEALDARDGGWRGRWVWPPHNRGQALSHAFRNFIVGGYVKDEPVLVSAQGTYEDMHLQAWRVDMSRRWEKHIAKDEPGARGSHMCPITDLDNDGVDELMWGERCIELDGGRELFCADRDSYRGHSDVIAPLLDRESGRWFIYTIREGDARVSPRVALFDDSGRRVWGQVDQGHMDMGWVARIGPDGRPIAMAIRIGHKTCGPDGRFHTDMAEFTFDALSGAPFALNYSIYRTIPVDLNGDGMHELVRGIASGNGEVIDRCGNVIANIGGPVAMASKFMDLPGEQLLSYHPDGMLRVWADRNAHDSEDALERYASRFYRTNNRLTSTGSNLGVLGGV